jgi:hypothetical protein
MGGEAADETGHPPVGEQAGQMGMELTGQDPRLDAGDEPAPRLLVHLAPRPMALLDEGRSRGVPEQLRVAREDGFRQGLQPQRVRRREAPGRLVFRQALQPAVKSQRGDGITARLNAFADIGHLHNEEGDVALEPTSSRWS